MPREKPPKPEELIERLEEKVPQFFNTVVIINPITHITVAIIERPEEKILQFIIDHLITINFYHHHYCHHHYCHHYYEVADLKAELESEAENTRSKVKPKANRLHCGGSAQTALWGVVCLKEKK